MELKENIKMAFVELRVNKTRGFLSMLGVIIGIAAVIIIVAIGNGLKYQIMSQFQGLGADRLFVFPSWDPKTKRSAVIEMSDLDDIAKINGILNVAPQIEWGGQVKYKEKNEEAQIKGVFSDYFDIANMKIDKGRLLTNSDDDLREKVCVLRPEIKKNLFADDEAVGKTIKIGEQRFEVVGVMSAEQSSMGPLRASDNSIFIPLQVAMRISKQKNIPVVSVQIADVLKSKKTGEQIKQVLREKHEFKANYYIFSPEDQLKDINTGMTIFTSVIGAIGGLSLLVGGIGIMNIMLASVAERTREVGVRKALGAKRKDILIQFLTEASTISGTGGFLGILVGLGLAKSITILTQGNVPTAILPSSVLIAFIFSMCVGLFFGIYPSSKAANLNPIEALRYE